MKRLNLTIPIVTVVLVVSAFGCFGGLSEAELAYSKGNELQEKALHDQAIQLDPAHTMAYLNRGNTYHNLGQYQRAIQDYDKAIQLDPGLPLAYINLSVAYWHLGQYTKWAADQAKACSLDSQYC